MKGKQSNRDNSGNNLIEYPVSIMVAGGNSAIYGQLDYITICTFNELDIKLVIMFMINLGTQLHNKSTIYRYGEDLSI